MLTVTYGNTENLKYSVGLQFVKFVKLRILIKIAFFVHLTRFLFSWVKQLSNS